MRKVYQHTLNEKPAYFNGHMIVYLSKFQRLRRSTVCSSLREIRDQQIASHEYCDKKFGDTRRVREYNYVLLNIGEHKQS